jgi:hypothetical protein
VIQFWFRPFSQRALGLFRLIVGSTLFFLYWSRHKDIEFFYSEKGLVPKALALDFFPEFIRPSWLLCFWSDQYLSLIHGSLLFGLLLVTFGIGGRIVIFVTWFLNTAFIQRNYAVNYGADIIGNIWLFYLILTGPGNWFTWKHFLKGPGYKPAEVMSDWLSTIGVRLVQVHLCIIYFYTGIEKLKGASWWDGTALWTVLINSQMVVADFEWIKYISVLVVALTWVTILFEIFFTPFVFSKRWRLPVLFFGLVFHLVIGVTMALMPFALIMLAPYPFFLIRAHSNRSTTS